MPKPKISYTELTYRVVRESAEPLPFTEILQRVNEITPITTKNPKQTIRNAIGQGHLIVATGDGRYGWRPRLMTGSALRLTLSEQDLAGQHLAFGDEVRDALWPSFFESQSRSDRGPVEVELPDGLITPFALIHLGNGQWGTAGSAEFWAWFKGVGALAGDHLIIQVLDGEAKQHRIEFEPRAARDEAAIAARNEAIVQESLTFVRKRHQGTASWDLTKHLLCTGYYRHPIPPDPLVEIWTPEVWQDEVIATPGFGSGDWHFTGEKIWQPSPDAELSGLFGAPVQVYDYENPPDLPREYDPARGERRPRASVKAQQGPVRSFTFRVSHRALPKVWRDIEIAEDQTLEDLHLLIQQAYEWWDDHLYSFFLSGEAWDRTSEIGSPWSDSGLHTHQVRIGQLGLQPGQKTLYLFDYGDNHEFDVHLLRVDPAAPKGMYPKIVARHGRAPEQYPDYDEGTGEMSWNPYFRP